MAGATFRREDTRDVRRVASRHSTNARNDRGPGAVVVCDRRSAGFPRGRDLWLIDNYDSFPLNLAHLLAQLGARVRIVRNDEVRVSDVLARRPVGVVVSPGPKTPKEAGISVPLIRACAAASPAVPVLGVCLGCQAIGEAFGGRVVRATAPVHGRATKVTHDGRGLFAGLPSPFRVARYHSLVVSPRGLPSVLESTAFAASGEIMGLRHRTLPIEGVQFHPESFLTRSGPAILAAFLSLCGVRARPASTVVE
jgi:anthranilate synthase component 2